MAAQSVQKLLSVTSPFIRPHSITCATHRPGICTAACSQDFWRRFCVSEKTFFKTVPDLWTWHPSVLSWMKYNNCGVYLCKWILTFSLLDDAHHLNMVGTAISIGSSPALQPASHWSTEEHPLRLDLLWPHFILYEYSSSFHHVFLPWILNLNESVFDLTNETQYKIRIKHNVWFLKSVHFYIFFNERKLEIDK